MKTLSLLVVCCFLLSCSKKDTRPIETPQPAGAVTSVDANSTASISGVVKFEGQAPPAQKVDTSLDPACSFTKDAKPTMPIEAKDGKLANVYVYVKRGLEGKHFAAPADKVIVDQVGCWYQPHVVAMMAGQTVEFRNSDSTQHNIHPAPTSAGNKESNDLQSPKGPPIDKRFDAAEVMMPVKCNQHPWMKMYVNVAEHPFFAVTSDDGAFELKGLPPGDYVIAAVHEKLGVQTMQVKIGAKEKKAGVEFSFKQ